MQKVVFNLLKPLTPPPTVWDKVYQWVLFRARIVIMIMELIVVLAFVLKIIEDTNARNKEKYIERLQSELAFFSSEIEPEIRNFQIRGTNYALIWEDSQIVSPILKEIFSYIQNTGAQVAVKSDKNRFSVYGYDDLASLRVLEAQMKNSQTFSSVFIDSLSLDEREVIENKGSFVLVAYAKKLTREKY